VISDVDKTLLDPSQHVYAGMKTLLDVLGEHGGNTHVISLRVKELEPLTDLALKRGGVGINSTAPGGWGTFFDAGHAHLDDEAIKLGGDEQKLRANREQELAEAGHGKFLSSQKFDAVNPGRAKDYLGDTNEGDKYLFLEKILEDDRNIAAGRPSVLGLTMLHVVDESPIPQLLIDEAAKPNGRVLLYKDAGDLANQLAARGRITAEQKAEIDAAFQHDALPPVFFDRLRGKRSKDQPATEVRRAEEQPKHGDLSRFYEDESYDARHDVTVRKAGGEYSVRRYRSGGEKLTEIQMKVHLRHSEGVTDADVARIQHETQDGLDRYYNTGYRLPNGDHFRVKAAFVDHPDEANLVAHVHAGDGPNSREHWFTGPDATPASRARALGQQLGLADGVSNGIGEPELLRLEEEIREARWQNDFQEITNGMRDICGDSSRYEPGHGWSVRQGKAKDPELAPKRDLTRFYADHGGEAAHPVTVSDYRREPIVGNDRSPFEDANVQPMHYGIQSGYEVRRYRSGDEHLTEITMKLHLRPGDGVTSADVMRIRREALEGVERHFNGGNRLPNGDRLNVKLELVDHPDQAHDVIDLHAGEGPTNQKHWYLEQAGGPTVWAHELGHQLGFLDEYRTNTVWRSGDDAPGVFDDHSLMGKLAEHSDVGLRERHLQQLHDDISRSREWSSLDETANAITEGRDRWADLPLEERQQQLARIEHEQLDVLRGRSAAPGEDLPIAELARRYALGDRGGGQDVLPRAKTTPGRKTLRLSGDELAELLQGVDLTRPIRVKGGHLSFGFEVEFRPIDGFEPKRYEYLDLATDHMEDNGKNRELASIPTDNMAEAIRQMKHFKAGLADDGGRLRSLHFTIQVPHEAMDAIGYPRVDAWSSRIGDVIQAWRLKYKSSHFALTQWSQARTAPKDFGFDTKGSLRQYGMGNGRHRIELRGFMDDPGAIEDMAKQIIVGIQHPELIRGFDAQQAQLFEQHPRASLEALLRASEGRDLTEQEQQNLSDMVSGLAGPQHVLPLMGYEAMPYLTPEERSRFAGATHDFLESTRKLMKEPRSEEERQQLALDSEMPLHWAFASRFQDLIQTWGNRVDLHGILKDTVLMRPGVREPMSPQLFDKLYHTTAPLELTAIVSRIHRAELRRVLREMPAAQLEHAARTVRLFPTKDAPDLTTHFAAELARRGLPTTASTETDRKLVTDVFDAQYPHTFAAYAARIEPADADRLLGLLDDARLRQLRAATSTYNDQSMRLRAAIGDELVRRGADPRLGKELDEAIAHMTPAQSRELIDRLDADQLKGLNSFMSPNNAGAAAHRPAFLEAAARHGLDYRSDAEIESALRGMTTADARHEVASIDTSNLRRLRNFMTPKDGIDERNRVHVIAELQQREAGEQAQTFDRARPDLTAFHQDGSESARHAVEVSERRLDQFLGREGGYVADSGYTVHRYAANGEHLTEVTVKVGFLPGRDVTPEDVARIQADATAGVDRYYNAGHRLPNGDHLNVKLEFVAPASAHLVVNLRDGEGPTNQHNWYTGEELGGTAWAHELGHQLGFLDEYVDRHTAFRQNGVAPGVFDDGSLMGSMWTSGADGTIRPNDELAIQPRHLQQLQDDIQRANGAEESPADGPGERARQAAIDRYGDHGALSAALEAKPEAAGPRALEQEIDRAVGLVRAQVPDAETHSSDSGVSAEMLLRLHPSPEKLDAIDRFGLLNQYQVGGNTWGGEGNLRARYWTETTMIGSPLSGEDPTLFPKYNYLNIKGRPSNISEGSARQYGGAILVFRPEMAARSQFHVGDSLYTKSAHPSLEDTAKLKEVMLEEPHYFEGEAWGPMTYDDVGQLLLEEGTDQPTVDKAVELAKKYGFSVHEYRIEGAFNESSPLTKRLLWAPEPSHRPRERVFQPPDAQQLVKSLDSVPPLELAQTIDVIARSGMPGAADLIANLYDVPNPPREQPPLYKPNEYRKTAVITALSTLGDPRAFVFAARFQGEGGGDTTGFMREHFNLDSDLVSPDKLRALAETNEGAAELIAFRLARYPDPRYQSLLDELAHSETPAVSKAAKQAADAAAFVPKPPILQPVVRSVVKASQDLLDSPEVTEEAIRNLLAEHPSVARESGARLVEALRRLPAGGEKLLAELMRDTGNADRRQVALQALGHREGTAAETLLIEALEHGDPAAVAIAEGALLARDTPRARAAVRRLYRKNLDGADLFTKVHLFEKLLDHHLVTPAIARQAEAVQAKAHDPGLEVLLARQHAPEPAASVAVVREPSITVRTQRHEALVDERGQPREWSDRSPATITVPGGYDVRRLTEDGRHVTEVTMKVHLRRGRGLIGAGIHYDDLVGIRHDMERLREDTTRAVEQNYNGYRLPNGDDLRVRVEFVDRPDRAHASVEVLAGEGLSTQHHWHLQSTGEVYAHELGHQLGLLDEYVDPTVQNRRHDDSPGVFHDGSVMGSVRDPDGTLRGGTGLRARHLEQLQRDIYAARGIQDHVATRGAEAAQPHEPATELPEHMLGGLLTKLHVKVEDVTGSKLTVMAKTLLEAKGIIKPTESQIKKTAFDLHKAIKSGHWQTFEAPFEGEMISSADGVNDRLGNIFFEQELFAPEQLTPENTKMSPTVRDHLVNGYESGLAGNVLAASFINTARRSEGDFSHSYGDRAWKGFLQAHMYLDSIPKGEFVDRLDIDTMIEVNRLVWAADKGLKAKALRFFAFFGRGLHWDRPGELRTGRALARESAYTAEQRAHMREIGIQVRETDHRLDASGDLKSAALHYPKAEEVRPRLLEILHQLKVELARPGADPILAASQFERRLVALHPFGDSNGRTARLLMNRILADYDYSPAIFSDQNQDISLSPQEFRDEVAKGILRSRRVLTSDGVKYKDYYLHELGIKGSDRSEKPVLIDGQGFQLGSDGLLYDITGRPYLAHDDELIPLGQMEHYMFARRIAGLQFQPEINEALGKVHAMEQRDAITEPGRRLFEKLVADPNAQHEFTIRDDARARRADMRYALDPSTEMGKILTDLSDFSKLDPRRVFAIPSANGTNATSVMSKYSQLDLELWYLERGLKGTKQKALAKQIHGYREQLFDMARQQMLGQLDPTRVSPENPEGFEVRFEKLMYDSSPLRHESLAKAIKADGDDKMVLWRGDYSFSRFIGMAPNNDPRQPSAVKIARQRAGLGQIANLYDDLNKLESSGVGKQYISTTSDLSLLAKVFAASDNSQQANLSKLPRRLRDRLLAWIAQDPNLTADQRRDLRAAADDAGSSFPPLASGPGREIRNLFGVPGTLLRLEMVERTNGRIEVTANRKAFRILLKKEGLLPGIYALGGPRFEQEQELHAIQTIWPWRIKKTFDARQLTEEFPVTQPEIAEPAPETDAAGEVPDLVASLEPTELLTPEGD
jgi:hypothetical protein